MARRRRSSLALSGDQARAALAILIQEGKLAAGEVRKALQRRDRLIRALRASLTALEAGAGSVGKRLFKNSPFPMVRKARPARRKITRRKPRTSAATRAMYRLQGSYLAALRPLKTQARAKIKAIRKESGVRAAIAAAKKMPR